MPHHHFFRNLSSTTEQPASSTARSCRRADTVLSSKYSDLHYTLQGIILNNSGRVNVYSNSNNTLHTPVSTLTNIFQPSQGHVIGRRFFAPQFGTVSPLNDGKRCPTGMLTDLVDFHRKIKLLITGCRTRTNRSHVQTQSVWYVSTM